MKQRLVTLAACFLGAAFGSGVATGVMTLADMRVSAQQVLPPPMTGAPQPTVGVNSIRHAGVDLDAITATAFFVARLSTEMPEHKKLLESIDQSLDTIETNSISTKELLEMVVTGKAVAEFRNQLLAEVDKKIAAARPPR